MAEHSTNKEESMAVFVNVVFGGKHCNDLSPEASSDIYCGGKRKLCHGRGICLSDHSGQIYYSCFTDSPANTVNIMTA